MNPITILSTEHALINRYINILRKNLEEIKATNTFDPLFIDFAVDFFKSYVNRSHHGKEEDVLFDMLRTKNASKEDKALIELFVNDHKKAREGIATLAEAKHRSLTGDNLAINTVISVIEEFLNFYPVHVINEEKNLFDHALKYFDEEEVNFISKRFNEINQGGMHEKYLALITVMEK